MAKKHRGTDLKDADQGGRTVKKATERAAATDLEIYINGARVEVSPELEAAVHRVYKGLSRELPKEMTTTQAAEFLDVSRPFVIKLIENGELPCRMVGTHRRVPTSALVEYREKMFHRASQAADEMARTSQELGLYDLGEPPTDAR
ncbi:MAG TPA: helix-turn-helix domain-containing protein [Gemmataceae bacterium]|nr:helix-turn-helix domain-containing protein [Gemmataceae bacterium]